MSFKIRRRIVALAAAMAVLPASAWAVMPVKTPYIQPHKALYDISLRNAKSSTGIADIHGQMFYNLEATCEAWVTTHRFVLIYDYIDNPSSQVVSEFQTVERRDGNHFEFKAKRVRDGQLQEEVDGKVDRPTAKSGKIFQARYTKPEPKSIDLAPGTLFPVLHTKQVIGDAREKKKFIRGDVFDGSDAEGPYQVSGLILKPISEAERRREWPRSVEKKLVGEPGWRTQVAIFPQTQDNNESASDYEMDVNLLDNGIVTDMSIRYADFGINQTLKALSANPDPLCQTAGGGTDEGASDAPKAAERPVPPALKRAEKKL